MPAVAAALLALCAPAVLLADDATELARGKNSYEAARFDEGVERFRTMLDPASSNALKDAATIERARVYYAACLVALERIDDADRQIEAVLRQNPLFEPDRAAFPSKVVDRFTVVYGRLKDEFEAATRVKAEAAERVRREQAAYLAELRRLAGQESVVDRSSRWVALVPFGAGQFQNGQTALGWTFLATETALAGLSIGSGYWKQHLDTQQGKKDPESLNQVRENWYEINLYSTLAFAAVAVGGIAHAQLTFVPETTRQQRTRPVPPPPKLVPAASFVPAGAVVGLGGIF